MTKKINFDTICYLILVGLFTVMVFAFCAFCALMAFGLTMMGIITAISLMFIGGLTIGLLIANEI